MSKKFPRGTKTAEVIRIIEANPGITAAMLQELMGGASIGDVTPTLFQLINHGRLVRRKERVGGAKLSYTYYTSVAPKVHKEAAPPKPKQAELPLEQVPDVLITIPVNGKDSLTLTVAEFHSLKSKLSGLNL